jgi:hypothetical protein
MPINEIPFVERLAGPATIDAEVRNRLVEDYHAALRGWWPTPFAPFFRERYKVDLTASYAGRSIPHPFGKGSGQLTMTAGQIRESAEAGLAFAVLKTVIGEDSAGQRSMGAWATDDTRMVVEPIVGQSNRTGWTVSWKGRGWGRSIQDYLELCREAFGQMAATGMVVAPSAKLHLPATIEEPWRVTEYEHVMGHLGKVWENSGNAGRMPFEKDFSPTLAGDDRTKSREILIRWLTEVVPNLRRVASNRMQLGLKLMNVVGPLELQRKIFETSLNLIDDQRPDFLIYANRLFDPDRPFENHRGIAYGGPDLSDRNLSMLDACRNIVWTNKTEISATGDIDSGRTAVEYALRGCSSAQMHTLFQVPMSYPVEVTVGRIRRVLARVIFEPNEGLVAWLEHARNRWGHVDSEGVSKWADLPVLKMAKG